MDLALEHKPNGRSVDMGHAYVHGHEVLDRSNSKNHEMWTQLYIYFVCGNLEMPLFDKVVVNEIGFLRYITLKLDISRELPSYHHYSHITPQIMFKSSKISSCSANSNKLLMATNWNIL